MDRPSIVFAFAPFDIASAMQSASVLVVFGNIMAAPCIFIMRALINTQPELKASAIFSLFLYFFQFLLFLSATLLPTLSKSHRHLLV